MGPPNQTIKQSRDIYCVLAVCNDLLEEPASRARPRAWERTPRCHPLGCPRGGATLVSEQGFLARDALSDLHLEDRESYTAEESRFGGMLRCGRLRVPLERPHQSEAIGPQRPGQSVPSGVEEAREGAQENGPWSPQGDCMVKRQGNGCCAVREAGAVL